MQEYESNGQRIIIAEPGAFRGKIDSFDAGAIGPSAYLLGWMQENDIQSLQISIEPHGNEGYPRGIIMARNGQRIEAGSIKTDGIGIVYHDGKQLKWKGVCIPDH